MALNGRFQGYLLASDGMRARPPSAVGLFNWDHRKGEDEAPFREVVEGLRQPLIGRVRIAGVKQAATGHHWGSAATL